MARPPKRPSARSWTSRSLAGAASDPNHPGSTTTLTDSNGNLAEQYFYLPFGQTWQSAGTSNPFQFTGRENDLTGLYYYRNRYYSPDLGRFLSEDPAGFGGSNGYAYADDDPVDLSDPPGLQPSPQHQQRCNAILRRVYGVIAELNRRIPLYNEFTDALGYHRFGGTEGGAVRLTAPQSHWRIIQEQREALLRHINDYLDYCDDRNNPSGRLPWAQISKVLNQIKELRAPLSHEEAMEIWRRGLRLIIVPLRAPIPIRLPAMPSASAGTETPTVPEVPVVEPTMTPVFGLE